MCIRDRVKACAICGSDIRIMHHGNPRVKFPHIIGHEIAGVVVEAVSYTHLDVYKRQTHCFATTSG